MSVYSGFATRQQETFYNKMIEKAIELLGQRLLQFYKNEASPDEAKWVKQVRKLWKYMQRMEKQKYIPPQFSTAFSPLAEFLKENCKSDCTSTLTSNYSIFGDNKSDISMILNQTPTPKHLTEQASIKEQMLSINRLKSIGDPNIRDQSSKSQLHVTSSSNNTIDGFLKNRKETVRGLMSRTQGPFNEEQLTNHDFNLSQRKTPYYQSKQTRSRALLGKSQASRPFTDLDYSKVQGKTKGDDKQYFTLSDKEALLRSRLNQTQRIRSRETKHSQDSTLGVIRFKKLSLEDSQPMKAERRARILKKLENDASNEKHTSINKRKYASQPKARGKNDNKSTNKDILPQIALKKPLYPQCQSTISQQQALSSISSRRSASSSSRNSSLQKKVSLSHINDNSLTNMNFKNNTINQKYLKNNENFKRGSHHNETADQGLLQAQEQKEDTLLAYTKPKRRLKKVKRFCKGPVKNREFVF